MATTHTTLDPDFKKHFNITDVHWVKNRSGQKDVYLITKDGNKCILKIYKDFNKRDIREIDIYNKFVALPDIPKLISVEKYDTDTISFEKYIEGNCLEDCKASYTKSDISISKLLTGVCTVMQPLWESKELIVHRDFKPSNFIIKPDKNPVVIDFGIAKDNADSTITTSYQPNSWPFASPEQLQHKKDLIHYRTDYFSLGAVGYYLYYQKLPFGDTRDNIEKNLQDKTYKIDLDLNSKLTPFFTEVLKVSIAERPRDTSQMFKLLQI